MDPEDDINHTPHLTAKRLRALGLRGINLGCGRDLRVGWLNSDITSLVEHTGEVTKQDVLAQIEVGYTAAHYLQHDVRQPFPIDTGVFEWAYSEHLLEHLSVAEAIGWLTEVRRILVPGGLLRITTPDLARYLSGYLDPDNGFFAEHRRQLERHSIATGRPVIVPDRRAWMVNQIFQMWGHQWIYDYDEIRHVCEHAGFDGKSLVRCEFRQGAVGDVAGLDLEWRRDETLYVELRA